MITSPLTLFAALLLLIFGGLGLALTVIAARQLGQSNAARHWPVTPGKIVAIEAKEYIYHRWHRPGRTRAVQLYEPQLEYEYFVKGVPYVSNRVGFGTYRFELEAATQFVQRLADDQISVHYNPRDPGQAVLDVNAPGTAVGLIVGFIFIVIGFATAAAIIGLMRGA